MLKIGILVIIIAAILMCFKDGRKFLYYIISSLDNFSRGASSNKLAAVSAIGISIWITKRFTTPENEIWILIIWLLFALLCLGIVVFNQIVELIQSYKNGKGGEIHFEQKPTLDQVLTAPKNESDGNK